MVIFSESYLQHLKHKAMAKALTIQIKVKTFKPYVDDGHQKHYANTFQEILNKQDPAIQYTIEYANENKSLNFLDTNKCCFDIYMLVMAFLRSTFSSYLLLMMLVTLLTPLTTNI